MSAQGMRLKALLKNYAARCGVPAQVALQNYMFERFLERLSRSPYRDHFVIKGGMLVSHLMGLATRTTMDLDATLRRMPLTGEAVLQAVNAIASIDLGDGTAFESIGMEPIRKDDVYGGFRVRLDALYDTLRTPLSIDISTGDAITPHPVEYEFGGMFGDETKISLWGYNVETILAEKVEAILSLGTLSTRPRDFYDVYILSRAGQFSPALFKEALLATAEHRGTAAVLNDAAERLDSLKQSAALHAQWNVYRAKFSYAREISLESTLAAVAELMAGWTP